MLRKIKQANDIWCSESQSFGLWFKQDAVSWALTIIACGMIGSYPYVV
jgi:hypothetical protein